MNNTIIYYLHKNNNIPFYIGKTINIKQRKQSHKNKFNSKILLEIIDEVPTSEWKFWEKYYISLFKSWGFKLDNKNNGGGGNTFLDQNTKDLISKKKKGVIYSKERNLKISIAQKGRKISKEENIKRSLSLKGYKHSIERNKKIGLTRKLNKCNQKSIIQLDKNLIQINEFYSLTEAVIKTNIKGIGNALTNRAKTAGGYIWKYK